MPFLSRKYVYRKRLFFIKKNRESKITCSSVFSKMHGLKILKSRSFSSRRWIIILIYHTLKKVLHIFSMPCKNLTSPIIWPILSALLKVVFSLSEEFSLKVLIAADFRVRELSGRKSAQLPRLLLIFGGALSRLWQFGASSWVTALDCPIGAAHRLINLSEWFYPHLSGTVVFQDPFLCKFKIS